MRRRFDSIGTLPERKLAALALAQALTLPLPALLERLELIVACVTSVWFEVGVSALARSSAPPTCCEAARCCHCTLMRHEPPVKGSKKWRVGCMP